MALSILGRRHAHLPPRRHHRICEGPRFRPDAVLALPVPNPDLWIGLLYLAIGFALWFVLVGFLILLWRLVWSLIRIIKGFIALNDNEPIANPGCWRFG